MIPFIQKGDLTKLSGKRRNSICGCETKCKVFFTFITDNNDSDYILCAGDAKQFGFEILEMIGAVKSGIMFIGPNRAWTGEEERLIENYFKEHDCFDDNGRVRHGINRGLAEVLGRTREQVKEKVKRMRKEGKLKEGLS
ncbi:hypothetical protein LC048_13650 [Mesobacillus subterraneus]|uniref:hypothetical protein n=1 Tax=Mesobacillus subterraneus TaxID=285983 RepID=UPI001CFF014A|nr:hypothetical protein [Mesobacillus subterraneus]WLR53568.1 hypothetical protein LC048_13650 [Mesobacillus subterraneus]